MECHSHVLLLSWYPDRIIDLTCDIFLHAWSHQAECYIRIFGYLAVIFRALVKCAIVFVLQALEDRRRSLDGANGEYV